MKKIAASFVICLSLFISSCGEDPAQAPSDAVIIGPADQTTIFSNPSTTARSAFYTPFEFVVVDQATPPRPIAGVVVELFAYGLATALVDIKNVELDPLNPFYFKTVTDDRGAVRAGLRVSVPPCLTEQADYDASMGATVGLGAKLSKITITVKKC